MGILNVFLLRGYFHFAAMVVSEKNTSCAKYIAVANNATNSKAITNAFLLICASISSAEGNDGGGG